MGTQHTVNEILVLENRAESVILYDKTWHNVDTNGQIYSNGSTGIQSVEITKEMLQSIISYFDNKKNREAFDLYG